MRDEKYQFLSIHNLLDELYTAVVSLTYISVLARHKEISLSSISVQIM